LIDTNGVSEFMRPRPSDNVIGWVRALRPGTAFLSAVSLGELLLGIELMPDGRRKLALGTETAGRIEALFQGLVLAFDAQAAGAFARVAGVTAKRGFTISKADAQIAATALVHGFYVATRDVRPFEAAGVAVINPWTA